MQRNKKNLIKNDWSHDLTQNECLVSKYSVENNQISSEWVGHLLRKTAPRHYNADGESRQYGDKV